MKQLALGNMKVWLDEQNLMCSMAMLEALKQGAYIDENAWLFFPLDTIRLHLDSFISPQLISKNIFSVVKAVMHASRCIRCDEGRCLAAHPRPAAYC